MRRVSMATRDELVAAVIERYSKGRRAEKGRILEEFVAVTGFHRKHALRVLPAGSSERRTRSRPERRVYDKAVREALIVLWEASDRVCGKRLKALAPLLVEAMERHGHLHLAPEVRASLLAMSAATIHVRREAPRSSWLACSCAGWHGSSPGRCRPIYGQDDARCRAQAPADWPLSGRGRRAPALHRARDR